LGYLHDTAYSCHQHNKSPHQICQS